MGVKFQRLFLYNTKIGWHWHKSWNIPTIVTTLEARSAEGVLGARQDDATEAAGEGEGDGADLCSSIGVKRRQSALAVRSWSERIHAEDLERWVGHVHQSEICDDLVLPRRKAESHIQGKPLQLLITFYLRINAVECKFIKSVLSPPIFVDSRWMARETGLCKVPWVFMGRCANSSP